MLHKPCICLENEVRPEKRRWFILAVFSLFSAGNMMAWMTYCPIMYQSQAFYGVSMQAIVQFSNVYLIAYVLFSYAGAWFCFKWFKWSMIISMIINALGSWIRYIAYKNYALAMFGQILGAVAQNFIMFAPAQIASTWFPIKERTVAVLIGTFSNYLGWALGFVFPIFFVNTDMGNMSGMDMTNMLDMNMSMDDTPAINSGIMNVLLWEAVIVTIPVLPGIFVFKDGPTVPPSVSEIVKKNAQIKTNYWESFWMMLKDWRLMFTINSFALCVGVSWTVATVIQNFLPPNFTVTKVGIAGLIFTGSGIVGGILGTIYLERNTPFTNYDKTIKSFVILSFVTLILMSVFTYTGDDSAIYILNAAAGLGLISFVPFAVQSIVESGFPIDETITVNMFMLLAELWGLVGNLISTASFVGSYGLWVLVVMVFPALIYTLSLFKTIYRRRRVEIMPQAGDAGVDLEDKKPVIENMEFAIMTSSGAAFSADSKKSDKEAERSDEVLSLSIAKTKEETVSVNI